MSTIIINSASSSRVLSSFMLTWCSFSYSIGFIISLASIVVIWMFPFAAPMPERKLIKRSSRRGSIASISTVESTTSTLVNETPVSSLEDKKESRKARRSSISDSLFHNAIVLHRPKSIARPLRPICCRLTSTMQTSIIIPASQIIPKSKCSAPNSFTKVARFASKASKKLVLKLGKDKHLPKGPYNLTAYFFYPSRLPRGTLAVPGDASLIDAFMQTKLHVACGRIP
ncbi:hypothetical protein BT96DRAFT_990165 [Gymnopus androsaceus JB14]|uniref:Uncharacterized protein n=1 Tax=Gymnopus androsaceus JB14 TaxID=1447944 RepID=A0A6A4I401_9AGAR|nr:hypothetical protein BT96DRAFT_990165 [Gymnopus androsaceus JB14]